MNNDIAVSIICNAYNHEPYIRDAIEGFIMQKTDFAFEILIHDDASTDKTADIIREYEIKYPDLIKPIYQTENKYSKKISIGMNYQFPRVKGKYIAVCEGDDFWTDPMKLQKQFDLMEKHHELDICVHRAEKIDALTRKHMGYVAPSDKNIIFDVERVIDEGGGFVATNSIFYRSELNAEIPNFRKKYPYDFALQTHGALRGGMMYLNDCMSVYRVNVKDSWTSRNHVDIGKFVEFLKSMDTYLTLLDEETNYKYSEIIQKKMLRSKVSHCHFLLKYKELKKAPYVEIYKKLPLRRKIVIALKYLFLWFKNRTL